jgi:hypothetical protein
MKEPIFHLLLSVDLIIILEAVPTTIALVIQYEAIDAAQPTTLHNSPRFVSDLDLPEPKVKPTTPTAIQL